MVQSDAQRIAEIYRRSGRYDVRVNPEIIEQPNNRVDLVFTITEGVKTGVKSIQFVGNSFYSSLSPEGHHQDPRVEPPELPRRQRRLRSRPRRGRPRPDPPLLSEARLCRRAGGRGADRIRSRPQGLPRHLQDRGRRSNTASASVQFAVQHRQPRRQRAAHLFARQCRLALQRRGGREIGRGNADRGLAPRLCLRGRASARRPQFRGPYRVGGVLDRGGAADLYRAHQHPRQHPHPRLRDSPRVRRCRGRRLQPRAGRPRRTAPEEPRLLQDREDQDRAGLVERPRHPGRRPRREIDRRLLGLGRLFDHRRRARRSQHLRAQLPRPRPVRQGVGDLRPICARRSRCHSSSPICWIIASRSGSMSSTASNSPTATSRTATKTIGFSPRLGFQLREDLSLQLRYSLYQTGDLAAVLSREL